jgi:hypothetical protein
MAIIGIFFILFGLLAVAATALHLLLLVMMLMLIPLFLLSFVFWIWMLIDAIKNENIGGNEKVVWVIAIGLTHWLGALVYCVAARSRQKVVTAPPLIAAS